MSEYTKKMNADWYSDPFYTDKEGYKMQLNVVPGGYDTAKGVYLSVYLYLMEGPHDDKLLWPLTGKFAVTLLNQVSDTGHHSVINSVEDANRIVSSLVDFNAEDVWDQPRFIKTHTLLNSQYLKNDSLFFEVSKM